MWKRHGLPQNTLMQVDQLDNFTAKSSCQMTANFLVYDPTFARQLIAQLSKTTTQYFQMHIEYRIATELCCADAYYGYGRINDAK